MGSPRKGPKDRYGFMRGTAKSEIAALVDQGLPTDDIVARKYLRDTIHHTRFEMKKAMKKWPNGYPAKEDVVPPPKKADGRIGVSVAKFPERFDQFGFKLGSKLASIAARLAAGETSAQILASDKTLNKFSVYTAAGRVSRGPTNARALTVPNVTALEPTRGRPKANGHDVQHPPAHVEMVLHDGQGREVPMFLSPDPVLVNYVLTKALRKLRLA